MSSFGDAIGGAFGSIPVIGGLFSAGKSLLGKAAGQSNFNANTYDIPYAPDAGNPAIRDYNSRKALYDNAVADYFNTHDVSFEQAQQIVAQTTPPPAPPTDNEIRAGQLVQDRARLIGTAAKYNPLITDLTAASQGKG